jgi:equilibrative nucleoside transporter 1/2/3
LRRISGGFLFIAVLMIILPLVANYLDPTPGFYSCLVVLFFFGAIGGIVQGSVFGLAGMLPGKFMGAVMFGNGLSGISINVMRAVCLSIFPPKTGSNNNFYGALVYFILAAILLVFSSFAFIYFIKLPIIQYYIRKATAEKLKSFRRISTQID